MRDFQDEVMLELIYVMNQYNPVLDTIKHALDDAKPASPLRKLMVDELTFMSYHGLEFDLSDLTIFDGVPGLLAELMQTQRRNSDGYPGGLDRLEMGLWKDFLFEAGPSKHWIWGY